MMEKMAAKSFTVKNVDCASCAAKIEQGLKTVGAVEEAVLDFATLTLHVKTNDMVRVLEEIKRLEPEVELVPKFEEKTQDAHDEKMERF